MIPPPTPSDLEHDADEDAHRIATVTPHSFDVDIDWPTYGRWLREVARVWICRAAAAEAQAARVYVPLDDGSPGPLTWRYRCEVAEASLRATEQEAALLRKRLKEQEDYWQTRAEETEARVTELETRLAEVSGQLPSRDLPPQPGDEKPVDPESGNGVTWGDLLGRVETP